MFCRVSRSLDRRTAGSGLHGPMIGFALLTLAPALLLAWLGWRGTSPLLDEVERGAAASVRHVHAAAMRDLPERAAEERRRLGARLAELAPQLHARLPGAAQPGAVLAELEGLAGLPLVVRRGAVRVVPAGPTAFSLEHLHEWPAFVAWRAANDRGAAAPMPEFVAGSLRALGIAHRVRVGHVEPDAGCRELAELDAHDLVAAGPLPFEVLASTAVGRRALARLHARGLLVSVPATEAARLRWMQLADASEAALAAQRLRAANERGTVPVVEVPVVEVTLSVGEVVLAGLVDLQPLCERLGFEQEGCAVVLRPESSGPASTASSAADRAVDVVATVFGPIAVHTEHLDLQRLRDGAERQRWISAFGIALLLIAMGSGTLLVRRALLRERRARQLRDEFIASVSHELKTPLTAMRMHTEMLTDRRLDDAQRGRYGAIAVSEGARLSALVDDLLDFAALERGRRRLEPEPVDLGTVVGAAADTWRGFAAQHTVELRCETFGAALALVDPIAVTRIVNNLLQNAFRHGAPARDGGRRRVLLRAGPGPQLRVCNNGPEIAPGDRERIFGRFERLRDGPGMGLGLAMSRELARACGGELECVDDLVDGDVATCFRLRLPDVPEFDETDLFASAEERS